MMLSSSPSSNQSSATTLTLLGDEKSSLSSLAVGRKMSIHRRCHQRRIASYSTTTSTTTNRWNNVALLLALALCCCILDNNNVLWKGGFVLFAAAQAANSSTADVGADITLACDPCIVRSQYTIQAIVHGNSMSPNSNNTSNNVQFWQQVEASMKQAAQNMNVELKLSMMDYYYSPISLSTSPESHYYMMSEESIKINMTDALLLALNDTTIDAVIVTLPNDAMVETLRAVRAAGDRVKPIFGMNVGQEYAQELQLDGYIGGGEDTTLGQVAGQEFLKYYNAVTSTVSTDNTTTTGGGALFTTAVYVDSVLEPPLSVTNQYETFSTTLREGGVFITQRIQIDPMDRVGHETLINILFEGGCPYPAILLNSKESVPYAIAASLMYNCTDKTQIGVTHISADIYQEINKGTILFGIDQQVHIQSALSVILASVYASTGLKLSLPHISTTTTTANDNLFLTTGPVVITADNVPSDTIQACQDESFPICSSKDMKNKKDDNTSACPCTDPKSIIIGGVVHGVVTDNFWDSVFLASEQAASDMGITLDMPRFEAADQTGGIDFVQEQMGAKIKSLCDANVNGLFVSIPGNESSPVYESILHCQGLKIPILSINSGATIASNLNLLHLSQSDYKAGYQAGTKLIAAGIRYGYCLDHETGNHALAERCSGLEASIRDHASPDVQYMGKYDVPFDNKIQYKLAIENAIATTLNGTMAADWSGVGFLLTGLKQLESYRDVFDAHPMAITGTFDIDSTVFDSIDEGVIKFGIDQQQYLQGNMPVYILSYLAMTQEFLFNKNVDTSAEIVTTSPSDSEKECRQNLYKVCPFDNTNGSDDNTTNANDDKDNDDAVDGDGSTVMNPVFAPPLITLDCDPCIDREEYTIHAILHGDPNDDTWKQAHASMMQAATDMDVRLEVYIQTEGLSQRIRQSAFDSNVNGLIVSISDSDVQQTVTDVMAQTRKPMFGMNVGYELAQALGLQGYFGRNDKLAGKGAATEFVRYFSSVNNTSFNTAVYVSSTTQVVTSTQYQLDSFTKELEKVPGFKIDSVIVDPTNSVDHENKIKALFYNCPYQAVFLGTRESISLAIDAKTANNCLETQIGVNDVSTNIYQLLTNKAVLFGIDHDIYVQSGATVVLTALYVTTAKKLSLPQKEISYLSNARVISQSITPWDTYQNCQAEAFPVCNGYQSTNLKQGVCTCSDRSLVRLGGVLHGDKADKFWDPVFIASEQAAADMGVDLKLERLDPQANSTVLHEQMAAHIKAMCQTGFDGIFVTIPSPIVREAVQICMDLQVPVISINTGLEDSEALGLTHHIAQIEYSAGWQAALKLAEAGMREAYCLNHAPGNPATMERCRGFVDGLATLNGQVSYMGEYTVPQDNKAQYVLDVEKAVGRSGDWAGIGFISIGLAQLPSLQEVVALHPAVIAGTFDVGPIVTESIQQGWLKFGIDQQPFLQGNLPVYLLTLMASSKQSLWNHKIESGPSMVTEPPTQDETVCEANVFLVCIPRPDEDMNFIPTGLLSFGYFLFGVMASMCIGTAIWIFIYRDEWVVKVSQPTLLLLVIFGCLVSSLSIIFIGIQTEYPNVQDNSTREPDGPVNPEIYLADASCMAVPWLYGMGFVLSFSALFAKIQRVKMIYRAGLRMQRKTIGFKDVAYIMAFLTTIELGILTTWQIVSPLEWDREVLQRDENGFPEESVGGCTYEKGWYFFVILVGFHVVCLFYALALCFQTKDINSDFAESSYISLAVAFMFQVLVLSVPISALVRDTTTVFYFIRVFSIFLQNVTVMALLFIPKIIRHHYGTKAENTSTSDGFNRSKFNLNNKSRMSVGPGDPSRTMLVSQQMTQRMQMSQHMLQCLSESDLNGSASNSRLISEEMLFLSELEKDASHSGVGGLEEQKPPTSPNGDDAHKSTGAETKSTDGTISNELKMEPSEQNEDDELHSDIEDDDTAATNNGRQNISPEAVLSNWQSLGFQSEEQAKHILALLSAEKTADERRDLIAKIANDE